MKQYTINHIHAQSDHHIKFSQTETIISCPSNNTCFKFRKLITRL